MYIRRVNHIQIFALSTSWELLRYARPSMRPPVWQSTRTPLSLRMSKSATRWDTNTNTMTPLLLRMTRNVTRWNTNTKTTLMLRISKIKNKINIMMLIFLLSSNTGVQEVLRVRQVWLWHRKGGKSNHQILIHSNQNTWCQVVLVLLFFSFLFHLQLEATYAGVLQQASERVRHSTENSFQEASGHNLREDSFRGLCPWQL